MRKLFLRLWRLVRRIWAIQRPGVQADIRLRQPLVFAAFAVALAWYLAAPTPTTVMAVVALGGLVFFGFLWVRALAVNLDASRHLRYAALQVGEELEEEINLANRNFLPALWAEFEDHSNIPGYTLASVRGVDGRSATHWHTTTLCRRRGVYTLGPWQIITSDPFGVFSLRLTFPGREEVLVYPPLAALPPHWLPKGRTVGEQRLLRRPLPAETINLVSTRPYIPGDPLHHIHWRTSARRESVFVKVFEPESYSSIWLIPDLDAAAQFPAAGEGEDDSLEKLIILTASVAAELLAERRAVGLFAVGAGGKTVIAPQSGAGHLWALLRGLAGLEAAAHQPFSSTLEQAARVISRRELVMALTPSTNADWAYTLAGRASTNAGLPHAGAVAILLLDGKGTSDSGLLDTLAALDLPTRSIRAAEVQPLSGSYGALQRWEFTTLGTGRAYARRKPRGVVALGLPEERRR